ncbi:MAG: thiol reductant ABC exporter subunit CydD [Asticcacaulis sp.]
MSHPSPRPSDIPPQTPPDDAKAHSKRVRAQLRLWAGSAKRQVTVMWQMEALSLLCAAAFALGLALVLAAVRDGRPVWGGLVLMMGGLLVRALVLYINQLISTSFARRIIENLRLDMLRKALNGRGVDGGQMARMGVLFEHTEALEGYYARFVPARMASTITPFIAALLIAVASPASGLIVLFTLCPFVAMMALSGMATAAEARRQLDALTRLSGLFADRLRHLPLIRAFDNSDAQTQKVRRAAGDVSERTLSVLRMAFTGSAVLEFFAALSVALIAVYCGFSLLGLLPFPVPAFLGFRGEAFISAFFALTLAPEVYAPLRRLSAAYHEEQQARVAAEALIELGERLETPDRTPLICAQAPAIRLTALSAMFADDSTPVFAPVSASIPAGTIVALRGETGSGKSTLLRLLLGITPNGLLQQQGTIAVDDQVLTPESDLSASLSWMSQHTPLLPGTLADNLRLSHPQATDDDLRRIIVQTGLEPLVAARGLEAVLDERGSGLSGGERRRIGLARALLKPAPLLLLDEPTADLDPGSEAAIADAIRNAASGRTVIMATHSAALAAIATQEIRL